MQMSYSAVCVDKKNIYEKMGKYVTCWNKNNFLYDTYIMIRKCYWQISRSVDCKKVIHKMTQDDDHG